MFQRGVSQPSGKGHIAACFATNNSVFERLLQPAPVCVCEREKSNCWHLTALKVALGFVLLTATWSFHSPPQKKPFSISLRFLSLFKGAGEACEWICACVCASVQEHLSQWEKSLFPPKERARRQCQRHWLEPATWEGEQEPASERTFERKRQERSLMWSSLVAFSRPHTYALATQWLMSRCDADIWKGKVRRRDKVGGEG